MFRISSSFAASAGGFQHCGWSQTINRHPPVLFWFILMLKRISAGITPRRTAFGQNEAGATNPEAGKSMKLKQVRRQSATCDGSVFLMRQSSCGFRVKWDLHAHTDRRREGWHSPPPSSSTVWVNPGTAVPILFILFSCLRVWFTRKTHQHMNSSVFPQIKGKRDATIQHTGVT